MVRPVSMMSSTRITSRPSMDIERSAVSRTIPEGRSIPAIGGDPHEIQIRRQRGGPEQVGGEDEGALSTPTKSGKRPA